MLTLGQPVSSQTQTCGMVDNTNFKITKMTTDGLKAAQSGNQGERRDQGDDQIEDGKTTQQGRREPPGSGKQ